MCERLLEFLYHFSPGPAPYKELCLSFPHEETHIVLCSLFEEKKSLLRQEVSERECYLKRYTEASKIKDKNAWEKLSLEIMVFALQHRPVASVDKSVMFIRSSLSSSPENGLGVFGLLKHAAQLPK